MRTVNIGGEVFRIPDLSKVFGKGILGIIIAIAIIWLLTGIYIVGPDSQGVVRTFGKMTRVVDPGLNYHLPYPIETIDIPKVMEVKRAEIGFRSVDPGPPASYRSIPNESLMLTGNLNIVDVDVSVQYRIKDPVKYLFQVRNLEQTIHNAGEAALRQVGGRRPIDDALTDRKEEIMQDTKAELQIILDLYECGIQVIAVQLQDANPPQEVDAAFKDVASAKEDREKMINEAQGYRNDLIPRTRGQAEKAIREAEAFRAERVTRAEGDSAKFVAVLLEYRKAPKVTKKRMLLETMEEILPSIDKYVIQTQKGGDAGILNLLNLRQSAGGSHE
ncbi:cell division protein FtsH [bacterium SM23_57]|nr:MAG: cell division protein FtsH [bacterium SM23_57]